MLQVLAPPYVPRIDPVQTAVVNITVPKGQYINYDLTAHKTVPLKQSRKDKDIYTWTLRDIEGINIEAAMPPLSSLNPSMTVTTIKKWEQIDLWAKERLYTDIMIDKEIMDRADEITQGAVSVNEKTRLILDYIRNNIRYVAADIDRGGFTPHSLKEIIVSRYGDCKDQAMLFISLLKCAGVEAFPVLVNPYPHEELLNVPAPNFLHIIALIPHEKDSIWLDPTSRSNPFPELSFSDQQRRAFVINGQGGKLTKTPSREVSTASFHNINSFLKNQTFSTVSIEASGSMSESLKTVFMQAGNVNAGEFFRALIKNYIEKVKFDSIAFPGLHNLNKPFNAHIHFHLDTVWEKEEAVLYSISLPKLPIVLFAGLESGAMPENRENDLVLFRVSITSTETYSPQKNSCSI